MGEWVSPAKYGVFISAFVAKCSNTTKSGQTQLPSLFAAAFQTPLASL